MITQFGYSKDKSILPEGIAVTFGKEMIESKGGLLKFVRWFETCMSQEGDLWFHKCKNRPTQDIIYVYIIICNRVHYKGYYGGHFKAGAGMCFMRPGDLEMQPIPFGHISIGGPIEKAPEKIIRKGFQGFRYTTKLF